MREYNNNPPFELHHSKDFSRLNVEALRGFPNRIKPPYVSWHFSTWPNLERHFEDAKSSTTSAKWQRSWYESHIEFVRLLVGSDKEHEIPRLDESSGDFIQDTLRGSVLTYEGLGFNEAILLRVEFHEEHVSYTLVLPIKDPSEIDEWSSRPPKKDFASEMSSDNAATGIAHGVTDSAVNELVEEVWKEVERWSRETDSEFQLRAAKAWDRLYGEIWSVAFRKAPRELNAAHSSSNIRPPGCAFSNFRGITLPRDWLIKAYGVDEIAYHARTKEEGGELFIPSDLQGLPFVLPKDQLKQDMGFKSDKFMGEDPPQTPRRWNRVSAGRSLVRNAALRHGLHWVGGETSEKFLEEPHFHRRTVANLVIDGRALYASSLAAAQDRTFGKGTLNDDPNNTAARHCIFYCSEQDEGAQNLLDRRLDRLLQRLNSLGTLRLLALKDIKGLLRVDSDLTNIENKITIVGSGAIGAKSKYQKTIQPLYIALTDLSKHTTGSVNYRVSKSALYFTQFERIVRTVYKHHHLERIEGFEPYSEFVNRRLYLQFDNINRIGERLKYARDRLDRIMELKSLTTTERLAKYTFRIGILAAVAGGIATIGVFLQLIRYKESIYKFLVGLF